jgi:hypothetical protein
VPPIPTGFCAPQRRVARRPTRLYPIDIIAVPPKVDAHAATLGPTQARKRLSEGRDARLRRRIVFVKPHEHADPSPAVAHRRRSAATRRESPFRSSKARRPRRPAWARVRGRTDIPAKPQERRKSRPHDRTDTQWRPFNVQ